ncbi:MAG: NAD(P)-dependent oxidoreductase [Verrucomicrobia bacterium]|nr:NAD(P)-dependent oxidoreductase [Verrucomicrobiota bacterium]
MNAFVNANVAVLGLGIIGSRAYGRLRDAGVATSCWNRTPKHLPGEVASPEDAVREAGIIALYLKDAPALREVIGRIRGLLALGHVVVQHSTVDLETTRWLDGVCADVGCGFLDAPFTGSKLAAQNGQLVYYIGGDPALAAALDPVLAHTSRLRLPCGAAGAATVVKLVTNLVSACTVQALAEALGIAARHGVDGDCLKRAVAENASGSPLAAMKLAAMIQGDFETHFSLGNMTKDARYALQLANDADLDVPAIESVLQRMNALCHSGFADLDYAALFKAYPPTA